MTTKIIAHTNQYNSQLLAEFAAIISKYDTPAKLDYALLQRHAVQLFGQLLTHQVSNFNSQTNAFLIEYLRRRQVKKLFSKTDLLWANTLFPAIEINTASDLTLVKKLLL